MSKPRGRKRQERLAAFDRVVSEYEAPLLRYTARILQDEDAAQDVVQDAFIKLFRRWKKELRPSPQVSSWLYRVAHNAAVDHLRKRSRRDQLHKSHAAERVSFVPPDRGEGFRVSEAAQQAAAALRSLSPREQQLVVLKVYEEKSYREMSDITGLSTGNIGYILHHAMRKLANRLKRERAI
mgnify:CR=1 FL=1